MARGTMHAWAGGCGRPQGMSCGAATVVGEGVGEMVGVGVLVGVLVGVMVLVGVGVGPQGTLGETKMCRL